VDSELRRRFLQFLNFDFAAVEMREMRIVRYDGRCDWPLRGQGAWALHRAWWRGEDPTETSAREPAGYTA
jgi:hypothetical protein